MKASKKLVELMKQSQAKDTKPFDTQGEVVRVEGDIAWVHFAGGVDETPVRMTVNAEVGDNVQVRVSGGDAFLVGNGTAPPTDDRKANQAIASIKPVADAAEESRNLLGEMKTAAEEAGTTLTQIYQDAVDAKEASEEAQESAAQAAISASNASASASSAAADANSAATSANAAGESASQAQAASEAAQLAALSSITTDTLHYLATSQASGVTTQTAGWTTTVQTMTSTDKYLWTYHTYTAANGTSVDSTPVITGTYGQDGTSVTILGSYNTLAELQAAHPTGSRGDSYMVAGDLYVWNGSAWENVGQIQGPQGPQGPQGVQGDRGPQGIQGVSGDDGATIWTTTTAPTTPNYTFSISNLSGVSGLTPKVGDIVIYSYYRYAITSVDSTTVRATSRVSIRGAQGAAGNDGVSVTAVQPQYYLSTSSSSATGGSWSNSLSYVTGRYIWTRDMVTYSDGTSAPSTEIYNSALTDACKDAAEALGLIEEHQEWFWHDVLGAHVLGETSGFRNDLTGNGMAIVDTSDNDTEVAHFGADGVQVGKIGEKHIEITNDAFNVYDEDESVPFSVTTEGSLKQGTVTSYASANSTGTTTARFATQIFLRGKLTDGRLYFGVSTSGKPTTFENYIEVSETSQTITVDGISFEATLAGASRISLVATNTTATRKYIAWQYTESYYTTSVKVNDASLDMSSTILAVADTVGTSLPTYSSASIYGHVATVTLAIYNASSIPVGGVIYRGTLFNCVPVRPVKLVGIASGGSNAIVGKLDSDGSIHITNTGKEALSIPQSSFLTLSATYIFK